MPTVPTYGNPRVQAAPLPGVRQSPNAPAEAFGGGAAGAAPFQEAKGLVSDIDRRYQAEEQEADENAVLEADGRLGAFQIQAETEARKVRGRDALGLQERVGADFTKTAAEIEKGLRSDRAKEAFRRRVHQRGESLTRGLSGYASGQYEEYLDQDSKARRENAHTAIGLHLDDPTRREQEINNILMAVGQDARRKGWSPEVQNAVATDELSRAHSAVVRGFLASDRDLDAQKYFDQVKGSGEMTAEDRDRLAPMLEEGSLRGEARELADAIMTNLPKKKSDGSTELVQATRSEAMDEAAKIERPDLRAKVEQLMDRDFARRDQAKAADHMDVLQKVDNIVEETGDVSQVPTDIWVQLPAREKRAFEVRAKQLNSAAPPDPDKAAEAFYALRDLSWRDPMKFLGENLLLYRNALEKSDYEKLVEIQAGIGKGDQKTKAEVDGYRGTAEIINSTIGAEKFKDKKKEEAVKRVVDAQIKTYKRQHNNAEPPDKEVQGIVDNALKKVLVTDYPWYSIHNDVYKYGYELAQESMDAMSKVPDADREQIESELAKTGEAVTPERVVSIYAKLLEQRVEKVKNGSK